MPDVLDDSFLRDGFPGFGFTVPAGRGDLLVAESSPTEHIEPSVLAALAAWAARCRALGWRLGVDDSAKSPYLFRTGLLRALERGAPDVSDVVSADGWVPLCRIRRRIDADRVGDLVIRTLHIEDSRLRQAVGVTIRELAYNAVEHGLCSDGAFFSAGWFHRQRRVTVAIAETGRGIDDTIRTRGFLSPGEDERHALEKALE